MVHLRLAVKFGIGVELKPMFFVVTVIEVFLKDLKKKVVYFSFHFKFVSLYRCIRLNVLSNFLNYIVRQDV